MKLEKNIAKLDEMAERLEKENLTVDEGLKLYDAAIGVAKACLEELNTRKGTLRALTEEMERLTNGAEENED